MTLSALGRFPYTARPVSITPQSGSAVVVSFAVADADGAAHAGYGVDGQTVQSTLDMIYDPEAGVSPAALYDELLVAVRSLQIAEAGGSLQWIEAGISQSFGITV